MNKITSSVNSHGAGYRYFKDSLTVNLDLFCCEKALALPNKKIYNKKNMEIFGYDAL